MALLSAAAVALLACSRNSSSSASSEPEDAGPDVGRAVTADGRLPDHPRSLPFEYVRPDVGAPLTDAEISVATTQYLDILAQTHWFKTTAERVHGWPETDPRGRYWYGTWWTGVRALREGGKVTYLHSPDGADNNGLRTAQLAEGACYAHTLWGSAEIEHLLRRLMRGVASWFFAMERGADDLSYRMARAAYPEAVVSNEMPLPLYIDYGANRPGNDGATAYYVHLPANPSWPDLWVRNMRSKDDIGHLLRALGELDTCDGHFRDARAEDDLVELRRRFQGFSQRTRDNGWVIETLDRDQNVVLPSEGLARFITLFECGALLTMEMVADRDPIDVDCGDGYDPGVEGIDAIKSSAMQVARSFHVGAVQQALLHARPDLAQKLQQGVAKRLDTVMDLIDKGKPPANFGTGDLVAFLLHAAHAGIPLTSREVRFLHGRIAEAHASYTSPARANDFRLFAVDAPDGEYSYEPGGSGIDWKDLGLVLGLCAAQYRNPNGRVAVDCDSIRRFTP